MSWTITGKVNKVTRAEFPQTGRTRIYVTAEAALTGPAVKATTVTLYAFEDDVPLTIGTSVKLTIEEG